MKQFFSKARQFLMQSGMGRYLWKCMRVVKADEFLYMIADILEPSFADADIQNAVVYFRIHQRQIRQIYRLLEDRLSKRTFRNVMKFRITGKRRYLWMVRRPMKEQYFMNEKYRKILPLQGEYFVDCGAYTGDTLARLMQIGTFKKYYAFEPNPQNFSGGGIFGQAGVELFPYALGEKAGICFFDSDQAGVSAVGKISDEGDLKVYVRSLDEMLNHRTVTFIKMDIEGAEISALKGAKDIIVNQKPTLAISVYHSNQDLLEIPLYIHRLVPGYRFYIRHYSSLYNDTVLYAIYGNQS